MAKVAVIVVGAGSGKRFGGGENKIFAKLDGQPLFLRALQLFVNREDVCQTLLVVAPGDMDQVKDKYGPNVGFMGAELVAGGSERHESVANGLAKVREEAEFIAVHDAARVCVAAQWIDAVFEAAGRDGSAVPVVPVNSTLKRIGKDKTIAETVPRAGLFLAQTPQVFRADLLRSAYEKQQAGQIAISGPITDDAQLVAAAGHRVCTVAGDPRNIKITARGDLPLAGAILRTLPQKKVDRLGTFEEAKW